MKPKIIVILGQTATGKSDLAVEIAKKFNGEIISADSRQVYKGLDIGSGKITKKEMRGIPHHLLDIQNPKKAFSVNDFKEHAEKSISQIIQKGKLPIVCGGTGFYIDALIKNIELPEVPPNKEFRTEHEKLSTDELYKKLQKLDPKRAKEIDLKNKVRLIRALEITNSLGKVPKVKSKPKYTHLSIGLSFDQETLNERIHKRLLKRIKGGMLEEAKNLHKKGLSFKRMEELGLEYRYMAKFLKKEINKTEMIEKLYTEIKHYAKRQKTWFKRDEGILWYTPNEMQKIFETITTFLNKN